MHGSGIEPPFPVVDPNELKRLLYCRIESSFSAEFAFFGFFCVLSFTF
ncbi:hypothetical protein D1AOALGA4SA_9469 [Olavius algarvensis Delta 1 endosymbiont]|nr:hypothetical protein D1AOALGA4SA_9469 [Olavius algarvensis Delta 1 endosymbiont]